MSMRTVPGTPDASDGAGGERRRRVAVVAGSVALAAIALGATACAATPSGSSSPLSLSGTAGPTTSSLPGVGVAPRGSPFATFTLTGKPESRGTYALTVTVNDSEPVIPQVSASTSWTLIVQ